MVSSCCVFLSAADGPDHTTGVQRLSVPLPRDSLPPAGSFYEAGATVPGDAREAGKAAARRHTEVVTALRHTADAPLGLTHRETIRLPPRRHGQGAQGRPRQDEARPRHRHGRRHLLLPPCRNSGDPPPLGSEPLADDSGGRTRCFACEPVLAAPTGTPAAGCRRSRPENAEDHGLALRRSDHHRRHRHPRHPALPYRPGFSRLDRKRTPCSVLPPTAATGSSACAAVRGFCNPSSAYAGRASTPSPTPSPNCRTQISRSPMNWPTSMTANIGAAPPHAPDASYCHSRHAG